MNNADQPKIAIVYDKVNTAFGGAEQVLSALHQVFPDAPLYTSLMTGSAARWLGEWRVVTTWLQNIPGFVRIHQLLTPFFPIAFESLSLDQFDVIISMTSSQAKGVMTKPQQLHICYMLTPTRYLFSHQTAYLSQYWFLRLPGIKQVLAAVAQYLRYWDFAAAYRPDFIIPISQLVAERIHHYYQRDTEQVIYPTIIEHSELSDTTDRRPVVSRKYGLVISRLVPYKRVEVAIQACVAQQLPLIVVGTGIDEYRLKNLFPQLTFIRESGQSIVEFLHAAEKAGTVILFVGSCSEEEKQQLYAVSKLSFMIGLEDFGITALEAVMHDVPVVIHSQSGVSELIKQYAVTVKDESIESVSQAVKQALTNPPAKMSLTDKQKLTTKKFASNFSKLVYDLWHRHQKMRKEYYVIS